MNLSINKAIPMKEINEYHEVVSEVLTALLKYAKTGKKKDGKVVLSLADKLKKANDRAPITFPEARAKFSSETKNEFQNFLERERRLNDKNWRPKVKAPK